MRVILSLLSWGFLWVLKPEGTLSSLTVRSRVVIWGSGGRGILSGLIEVPPDLMALISLTQLTPEEEEKRRVRRERNKLAAAKCRNRRRELTDRLQAVRRGLGVSRGCAGSTLPCSSPISCCACVLNEEHPS